MSLKFKARLRSETRSRKSEISCHWCPESEIGGWLSQKPVQCGPCVSAIRTDGAVLVLLDSKRHYEIASGT
jgi:hypothetical protein